jgi:hypothetical protein
MKKQAMAFGLRKLSLHIFMFLALIVNSPFLKAQQKNLSSHIQYLGKVNGKSLVEVNFTNIDNIPFQVILINDEGSRIYTEKRDSGNFSKRFLIVKEVFDDGDLDLTLNIRTSNKTLSQVLKVSSRSFLKEEVYIASIKQ